MPTLLLSWARPAVWLAEQLGAKSVTFHPSRARSDRAWEVLQLVANGFSNREIGELLAIAEGTVKTHVVSILSKLPARDRTEAVTTALTRGILHVS